MPIYRLRHCYQHHTIHQKRACEGHSSRQQVERRSPSTTDLVRKINPTVTTPEGPRKHDRFVFLFNSNSRATDHNPEHKSTVPLGKRIRHSATESGCNSHGLGACFQLSDDRHSLGIKACFGSGRSRHSERKFAIPRSAVGTRYGQEAGYAGQE